MDLATVLDMGIVMPLVMVTVPVPGMDLVLAGDLDLVEGMMMNLVMAPVMVTVLVMVLDSVLVVVLDPVMALDMRMELVILRGELNG